MFVLALLSLQNMAESISWDTSSTAGPLSQHGNIPFFTFTSAPAAYSSDDTKIEKFLKKRERYYPCTEGRRTTGPTLQITPYKASTDTFLQTKGALWEDTIILAINVHWTIRQIKTLLPGYNYAKEHCMTLQDSINVKRHCVFVKNQKTHFLN